MKSLLLTDYTHLEVTDSPTPRPGEDELLVRVQACGICGSDIHGFDGSSGRRIPPLIMGHEAAGVVAEVGQRVRNWRIGDHVTFDSTISCGQCHFCAAGQINLCDRRNVLGVSCGEYRRDGAFAEYVCVPERVVYALPKELPFEQAALVEPVSVAVHAVSRTPVSPDARVVVVGAGMIGLLVVQALRAAGCRAIAAVDLDADRLQLAAEFGATDTWQVGATDIAGAIAELTDGRGADAAIEVVGATAPLATCLDAVRKGGHVTLVGNLTPTVDLPLQRVVTGELTLAGSCGSQGEYPECIRLLEQGQIRVEPLISEVVPLDDGPQWFARLYEGDPGLMKVVLQP